MLHAVRWKVRSDIVADRKPKELLESTSTQILKNMSSDELQIKFKDEMTEYVKSLVTKSSNSTVSSIKTQSKNLRRNLLQAI
jgi:hypothetical protein